MNELATMQEEITSLPELPEVEWTRLRALEFQEALRQRTSYTDRLVKLGCQLCDNFEDHVRPAPHLALPKATLMISSTRLCTKSRWWRVVWHHWNWHFPIRIWNCCPITIPEWTSWNHWNSLMIIRPSYSKVELRARSVPSFLVRT